MMFILVGFSVVIHLFAISYILLEAYRGLEKDENKIKLCNLYHDVLAVLGYV